MAAARTIGRMQEFNPANETVTAYLERLQLFVSANSIADDKRVPTLLTVVGAEHYSLLRGLVSPQLPKDKSFDELVTLLTKHYDPEPIVIAERFHFYRRNQGSNESVGDYLAQLRCLASRCKFGTFLDEALRDRLVCGLESENVQKVLLTKANLTLDKALEISQGMKAASVKAKELKGNHRVNPVLSLKGPTPALTPTQPCSRCGRGNHDPSTCRFKNATCHHCGKTGHIAPVCRSKAAGKPRKGPTKRANWLSSTPSSPDTASQPKENTSGQTEGTPQPLFVVQNNASSPYSVQLQVNGHPLQMEVDTGAAVSLAPESAVSALLPSTELQPSTAILRTYTGEQIPVKGVLPVTVHYGQQTHRNLKLLVVSGPGPCLLGRDWLRVIRLDWRQIAKVSASIPSSGDLAAQVSALQGRYHEVFADGLGTISPFLANLSVSTDAKPKFFKPRPVPFALRAKVEGELDRLTRDGVLVKVPYCDWAAPVVAVPKADGGIRLCGDYKVTVNPVLDIDQYPLPKPDDIFATLSGGQLFTTLDLTHAYNQLLLDENSRKFVTINTHKGMYQYTRLPFGIASAPAVFQCTMDTILQGAEGVACYIDDIIVTGRTPAEHIEHLEEVLKRLLRHGVRVKRQKCRFLQPSVSFLGHRIDATGIHPLDDKLQAIVQAPAPTNVPELRSFLGLINYYGKFIQNAATILAPLNQLLRKDAKWRWSSECARSFEEAKTVLSSSSVLVHYDPALPIRLAGDASAYGIGAVIAHVMPDGSERPVAFASRTLSSSERNYAQVEKEALSLIYGVKHFHSYLYGRQFTLVTDHKPLTAILGPKKGIPPLAAARLQRWAWILSAYSYQIEFRPTGDHSNADGLSRLPLRISPPDDPYADPKVFNVSQMEALPVTLRRLRAATSSDKALSKAIRYTKGSWPSQVPAHPRPYFHRRNELTVEEGCLLWGFRVVIPQKLHKRMLHELHTDHPGVSRMKSVARSYFWWPGLDKDIENLAKSCSACQAVKRAPPTVPLQPWVWPSRPWQRIHLDYAGPFQGHMWLIAVDAFSKWPEVKVMSSTTVSATLDALREWFGTHGIPEQLVTDNGPQFTADAFKEFTQLNGIRHIKSAPYHPASNGLAERFIQSLKQSLKASLNDGRSLTQRISSYLLTYRTTAHATTGVSPSQLLMSRELRTRFSLLQPDREKTVADKQAAQKESHDRRAHDREWIVGDRAMARNLRPGADWVPCTIVEVLGPVTYLVDTDQGQRWKRHADQLKTWLPPLSAPSLEVDVEPDLSSDLSSDLPEDPPNESAPPESTEESSTPSESPSSPSSELVAPRYPQRNRRPPDRFE